jgi:ADP-ribosylglycohydrolase
MPKSKRKKERFVTKKQAKDCLLGGAIGDALGAPIEFMGLNEILAKFGPKGLTDYSPAYGRLGAITDDTQMTLFTAEGLIGAYVRWCIKGISSASSVTEFAYLRWLYTQENSSPPTSSDDFCEHSLVDICGWLITKPELYHRRNPGNTCISVLSDLNQGIYKKKSELNNSKGCGAVMRMAPAGLMMYGFGDKAFSTGVELAALTHGHPTGQLPAGVFAEVISCLVGGNSLLEAIEESIIKLKSYPQHEETLNAINLALELAANENISSVEAITKIGQGWVAEEALAISIYCSLKAKSFREGVLMAVNHSGDSDSTGSITGNILGLIHGLTKIPRNWLKDLELREIISEIAVDLANSVYWDVGADESFDEDWVLKKYSDG